MAVLDLAAFTEERVGLVKQQDRPRLFRGFENVAQIFFGFANVLAHHAGQVDAIQIDVQLPGQNFGGHRLSRPARAGEQRADTAASRQPSAETPLLVNQRSRRHLIRDFSQLSEYVFWQNDVLPAITRLQALSEITQPPAHLFATRLPQVIRCHRCVLSGPSPRFRDGRVHSLRNCLGTQIELLHDGFDLAVDIHRDAVGSGFVTRPALADPTGFMSRQ